MKNVLRYVLFVLLCVGSRQVNAQVPLYNSLPSATATVFLDFDGHTVSGTSWNYSGPIVCGGANLTTAQITEIFNRVAEDYRPFNINITTDSTKYLAAPIAQRMRVILTVSSSWYGSAGGVSFVGSFTWGDDTPAFVFTALLNYNTKNIAEAAAHETGHTLGQYHQAVYDAQCNKLSDYNTGTGTGEIGWAPIMGVGYTQNLTLWNNGPNSFGCGNLQSDLDIITSNNGFSYRTDDHGNTFAAATTASISSNQFSVNGIIEKNTDVDMIKFTMPSGGRFQLDATPYNVGTGNSGSDLDMQVSLYNSSQTLLNVYNPSNLLSSVIDTSLGAGTYYLRVEGKGNIYAPNYASLGSYSLQAKMLSTLPLHKLELTGSASGDNHKLNWEIVADERITDLGVEMSTDGRNFSRITTVSNDARSFTYRPYVSGNVQYRLNVSFDDGRQYYSNVVNIKGNSAARPQLVGNLVTGSSIRVSSPGNFNYALMDLNGRVLRKGNLVNGINTIDAGNLINGMYIIKFADNEQQWTDKIVRQ